MSEMLSNAWAGYASRCFVPTNPVPRAMDRQVQNGLDRHADMAPLGFLPPHLVLACPAALHRPPVAPFYTPGPALQRLLLFRAHVWVESGSMLYATV